MSGKGGVGKSSISVLVAQALAAKHRVLVLDFDICGPSITTAFGIQGRLVKTANGFTPLLGPNNIDVLSFGSVLKPEDAVIWRGPKKQGFLKMFYESIGGYDYVVIDTPPGISEEHGFLCGKEINALIVTTPQNVALSDTQRCIEFCTENGIYIWGVVENMAWLECECCQEIQRPFGSKGGQLLAEEYSLRYWGQLPIEPELSRSCDNGTFNQIYNELFSYNFLNDKLYTEAFLDALIPKDTDKE